MAVTSSSSELATDWTIDAVVIFDLAESEHPRILQDSHQESPHVCLIFRLLSDFSSFL